MSTTIGVLYAQEKAVMSSLSHVEDMGWTTTNAGATGLTPMAQMQP